MIRFGAALAVALAGCLPATVPPGAVDRSPEPDGLVPAGYGSLRQEDVTLTLRAADLQIKVTPLAESVIRLTAPDTYQRLAGAVERLPADERAGRLPVLVSLTTDAAGGAAYEPRDLVLLNRGRLHRAEVVRGLTQGWGTGRVEQRRTQQAVFLFDGDIDLEMDLVVQLGDARNADWSQIVPRLEAERARVRARAAGGVSPR